MKVLVTGADGFIGKNLRAALPAGRGVELLPVTRGTTPYELAAAAAVAERVIHLAGVNRPRDPAEFAVGNADFTAHLTAVLRAAGRALPVAFASSIQAERDNPYGRSKREAEEHLLAFAEATGSPVVVYRLANVFGRWSRPNYNSVVATFCHNIARRLPIDIHDPAAALRLVHVDDVVRELVRFVESPPEKAGFAEVTPVYETTVGELARRIESFRDRFEAPAVAADGGLAGALFATYVSFLPPAGAGGGGPDTIAREMGEEEE